MRWRESLAAALSAILALAATGTLAGVAFAQGAQNRPAPIGAPHSSVKLPVTLDGHPLGTIGLSRFHDTPLVALAPLAHALHWRYQPTALGAQLDDGTGARGLRVGSRFVREDGTDISLFNEPLVERDGQLMLSVDDAATLFSLHVTATRAATIVFASDDTSTQGPVTVSEIPKPVPRIKATPRPVATQAAPNGIDSEAGQFVFTLEQDGKQRLFSTGIQARGSLLRANVLSAGANPLNPPLGTVRLGTNDRNTSFGASTDPLAGLLMRNSLFNGVDAFNKNGTRGTDLIIGRRPADGRSLIGIVRAHGSTSDALAVLTKNGHYDQIVVRHTAAQRAAWGSVIEEWVASERGVGGSVNVKSAGRTFVESTISVATQGLPLSENDAPTTLLVGRNFSPALSGTAGLALSRGNPLSPYLGLSVRTTSLALAVNGTPHTVSASLAYRGSRGNAQIEVVPGVNRVIAGQGMLTFRKGQLEFEAATERGEGNGSLLYRTTRPGINFLAGLGKLSGRAIGPMVGLVVPITHRLGIEASIKPGTINASALHLSLVAGIPARHPHVVTYPLVVHLEGVAPGVPLRILIDGAPIAKFQNSETIVHLTPGGHDIFVETIDGSLGSPSRSIDIISAAETKLMMWPQRIVRGRIRLDAGAAQLPPDLSLGGIALSIVPGNVSVTTDAEGNFVFARQPFDPEAMLSVDADTLPRGFAAPLPIAIGDGAPLEVVVSSARRVERQIFK